MKRYLAGILAALSLLLAPGATAARPGYKTDKIRDMVLIYNGASYRPAWNQSELEPYVVHTFADGHKEWLYDGFLFLEFDKGNGVEYQIPTVPRKPSKQADWNDYLAKLFAPGRSLDALDKCIGNARKELGDPGFRHRVVIMVPTPCTDDWGEVKGKKLNCTRLKDQEKACRWYIDELIDRFNRQGYKNIELHGIYWVTESMEKTGKIAKKVGPYVRKKGLEFVWIPWYKSFGAEKWKKYGFDIAYQQPNYFFHPEVAKSRFDDACRIARNANMGMEFEADERLLQSDSATFRPRMADYIDAYERNGVWQHAALAHYLGTNLLGKMSKSDSPDVHALADRYARHIIARRGYPGL